MSCCVPAFFSSSARRMSYLDNINYENTVPFIPPVKYGKVVKVYDGDTITLASRILNGTEIYRFSVRLNGIDSPEIKGKTEEEKQSAIKSREALKKLIFNKCVKLYSVKTEKYGRILADVYLDDLHVNKWMLDNQLAEPYDGGTKKKFEDFYKK
tara:strand:- start:34 stop:495 length:462 start_codon:yes stop_codon:yes gene_type:complete